jgi:NADPH-dependent ferric siderophore reductase
MQAFRDNGYADRYVKVIFPPPGVQYPEPFDMDAVRRDLPAAQWPRLRTYTVRDYWPDAEEMTIDVVYHGDAGLGGPWAASVQPGASMVMTGPGGGYNPDPEADWHLLVGDESALPAIGAALRRVPAGVPAIAVIEVSGYLDEQDLSCPGDLRVLWLHRGGRVAGHPATLDLLPSAVRRLEFPAGRAHAFVHGEAGAVKNIRRYLLGERGLPRDALSASGYWRRGVADEDFRVQKAAEKAADAGRDPGLAAAS